MHGLSSTFLRDERGAALTEFTIFLPVFVLTFVAIMQLWAIEDLGVRGKANGYAKAMAHHTRIQTTLNPISWQMSPISGMGNALYYHQRTSSGTDLAADILLETPVGQGHLGESYTRVLLAGPPSDTADTMMRGTPIVYTPPPAKLYSRVGGGGIAIGPALTPDRARPVITQFGVQPWMNPETNFTNHLFSDHFDPGQLAGSGGQPWYSGFINNALSAGGLRPAVAAGMRYGVTSEGYHDETTSILGRSYTVQSATHVTAPTRPTSRYISTAVVRAFLTQDEAYDEHILKFAMSPALAADSPDAAAFQECADTYSSLSIDNVLDVLSGDFTGGNPCQNGASYSGANPFEAFIRIFDNAKAVLGTSNIPTGTSSGHYGNNPRPLGL